MSAPLSGLVEVGTEALPIALSANGGATDTATWTHNAGRKAKLIEVVESVSGAIVGNDRVGTVSSTSAFVTVTQPTVNSIVVVNLCNDVVLNCTLRVTFDDSSVAVGEAVAASAVVLSA